MKKTGEGEGREGEDVRKNRNRDGKMKKEKGDETGEGGKIAP